MCLAKNDTELVLAALQSAILFRGVIRRGIIHHSDRGSTYASTRYQQLLKAYGFELSMSGKGNCYDNAAMESFFGRMKTSQIQDSVYLDLNHARSIVFEYIEVFYNRYRKHSSLGYKNPSQFEEETLSRNPLGGCTPINNHNTNTHN